MAVSISPSTEACEAIVDQINAGTTYALSVDAKIAEEFVDDQQSMDGLRVDVVAIDERQAADTLAVEDRWRVTIGIEIRNRLDGIEQFRVDAMKLIIAQVFQRINDFDSDDGRVKVWECAYEANENPNKRLLKESLIFRSRITLVVYVENSL